jgi:hypothetical protein
MPDIHPVLVERIRPGALTLFSTNPGMEPQGKRLV